MQFDITLPSAGREPPWHSRQTAMVGIATSEDFFDCATSWHRSHFSWGCDLWLKLARGIHSDAARTGATRHSSFSRATSWHVLHTRTSNISSPTLRALERARRSALSRSAGPGSPTRRSRPSPGTPKAFWKLSRTPWRARFA